MKKGSPISWPVLAFCVVGIISTVLLLKFGTSRHTEKASSNPSSSVQQQSSASVASAETAPEKLAVGDLPPVIPISLTNYFSAAETNLAQVDGAMKALPMGTQTFGGIEFWMQGVIHLQGLATRDDQHKNFRERVDVALTETNSIDGKTVVNQRGKNIASIYLIAATRYSSPAGERFADIVWHYADGSTKRSELQYGVHLRDWARTAYEQPAELPYEFTRVAWMGRHPSQKERRTLRLYRIAFLNPRPEKIVRSIEFASGMNRPSLFVMALTLDPLKPGTRPNDDLTSREWSDPELKGLLQLYVQDADGHLLANAQISSRSQSGGAGSVNQKFTTDQTGVAYVRYPSDDLETLEVSASHDDFSGRKVLWNPKGGDAVPASYVLKLGRSVNIGGIVVDTEDNPVAGANVSLYRFWSGEDMYDPNRKGEQADFSRQTQTTDAQGRWHAKDLPLELLDHIGMDVSHRDYIGTNANVSQAEKQFREETYKFVLHHGLEVRGRVLDDHDNPVSGATVWVGKKYYRERQQAKSDAQGRFSFRNVNEGDALFSVMADGRSPDNKTVNVHSQMEEIVFRLAAGNVIRATIQNENGEPLANTRIGLEGNYGDPAHDAYEFSANTDSNGKFQWNGAPSDPMTFYAFHDGYEAKRDIKLTPNQDNTVTMHRSRTLQGVVLDANTEQPVKRFTIRTGTRGNNDTDVYGVVRYHDFSSDDGKFSTPIQEENENAVLVVAAGYADKVEPFSEPQNGTVQVVVRMKPSATLDAVVLGPDGSPAPGVTVAATPAQPGSSSVQLSNGRLKSYSRSKMVVTDDEGKFQIPSLPESGGMIVAAGGEAGFGMASVEDVRASGVVRLQAWGRIEGTLNIAGQPAPGKDLMIQLDTPGIYPDWNGYKATTDQQGAFTFEKVPPGELSIVRLVPTSANSWSHSYGTRVQVQSGQTTTVTLGDSGAIVRGNVRFEMPPTNSESLMITGNLSSQMPSSPSFNSSEEAHAYYNSPEWKDLMKQHKNFAFVVAKDGSFMVDSVPPGQYSLSISAQKNMENAWRQPAVAMGYTAVTVPDNVAPNSDIYAGEILLRMNTQNSGSFHIP